MMKLALGTVQFGLNYGVSNAQGQVPPQEVGRILEYAKTAGISLLDTAQGYGNSERVLGQFDLSGFKVVTKVKGRYDLAPSLENMHVKSIYGLMLHDENEMNPETWHWLTECKAKGLVEKIGVSVYTPARLVQIISEFPIDLVQIPVNLLDQRFIPLLPALKARQIEIHARSAFLQGLLLQSLDQINAYFDPIRPVLEKIPQDRLATVLQFVHNLPEIDQVVVGVTSLQELQQIVTALARKTVPIVANQFTISDDDFILPQNWKLK